MSPQPDCGKGFVVSFVAASNDDGSLDLSSDAWKDGVAGAFSGAFSGMNAKGFFADDAGASGDVGARRFGFREGGGEKTNSGATGAAAAALPKIDGGLAGATGAPSSSGAVNANSSSSSSSSSSAGAGAGAGGEKGAAAGGENGDAGAGAGGAEKLNGLAAAGAGAGAGAPKLNGLAAAGAGAGAAGAFGASGDANGLAGAAPKG